MTQTPMTLAGERALRTELDTLKKATRPSISKAIGEARAFGDLKENAEYHAAKEQQGLVENRIRQIEMRLATAQVIDVTKIAPTGRVIFGTTVKLLCITDNTKATYRIVGEDEADIDTGLISVLSPVARGLIGKSQGECVLVETPDGDKEYEIKSVEHL